MDLPPPHNHHHNLRYGNLLHPPTFIPPPYTLPPPPPPPPIPPPRIFLPPPPPLPSQSFTFFPPPQTLIPERSNLYELNPQSKPYFHDHPPVSKVDSFSQGYFGNCSHKLPEFGDRGFSSRVMDVGENERCFRRRYNDDEVFDFERRLGVRYDERREGSGSRWKGSVSERVREMYNERRLGIGGNDRVREFYNTREVERRWDLGRDDDRVREFYNEVGDEERRGGFGGKDGVLSRLGNREKEGELEFGRFSGRLGRRVSSNNGENVRPSKKRKVQKKSAVVNGKQLGKGCQLGSKESSFVERKDGEELEGLGTEVEGNREREQSPVELAISFGLNGLVAKTILSPSPPEINVVNELTPKKRKTGKANSVYGGPRSSKDMVKADLSTHVLDPSESHGISEKLLDKPRSPALTNTVGSGKIDVKNEPGKDMKLQVSINVGSSKKRARKLRRKKRKQLLYETSLKMSMDNNGEIINANSSSSFPSVDSQLNSSCTMSNGSVVPYLLPSLGDSKKVDSSDGFYGPLGTNPKSKGSNLTTLSASPNKADKVISKCPDNEERLLTTSEDADHVGKLETDEVAGHARETFLFSETSDKNEHASNVHISVKNLASVLNSEKNAIESINSTDRVDDSSEHALEGGLVLLEKALEVQKAHSTSESYSKLLREPDNVFISDVSSVDALSKEFLSNQVSIPETRLKAVDLRSLESIAVSGGSNLVPSTSSNVLPGDQKCIMAEFDVSFLNSISKKSFYDGIGYPEAINNVRTSISVTDSSKRKRKRKRKSRCDSETNAILDIVSSVSGEVARDLTKDLTSTVGMDISSEKDNCKGDASLNEGPSGADESTRDVDIVTTGYSKKRKVISPRLSISALSEDDSIANDLPRDCSKPDQGPTEYVADLKEDIPSSASVSTNECGNTDMEGKASLKNYYVADMDKTIDDSNKLHTVDDLAFVPKNKILCADGNSVSTPSSDDELFSYGKTSPVSSPEDLLSHSDFCFPRNTDASASQSIDQIIGGRGKISVRKPLSADLITFSVGKPLEKASLHRSQINSRIPHNSYVAPKLNLVNGKLTMRENQLTSAVHKTFQSHPPIKFSNSSKLPSTHATKSRTWHRADNSSIVATEPKLQPCPPPQTHGPKMAGATHSSYIRKGNSLVRTPSPSGVHLPGSNGLSTSVYKRSPSTNNLKKNPPSDSSNIRNVDDPNSLVRKCSPSGVRPPGSHGLSTSVYRRSPSTDNLKKSPSTNSSNNGNVDDPNSLVRKPSPSGVPPPGLHGLSSLVYRRSPFTDNLKKSPPSDSSNNGNVDVPAVPRIERVHASEMPEAISVNHSEKSLGALEDSKKSSAVSECQAGTVSNADRRSATEEHISKKKITYVKRRSYELVATSDSKDVSVIGNTKATSSDRYYKKRKNQLVRSSLENPVKEGDVMVKGNTYKLGSTAIPLKSSNKRLSGFPKTYRSSKVSFVWKLHDAKCSGKPKNLLRPEKVWPYLFPWRRATLRRNFMHALGSKTNNSSFFTTSEKLPLSGKRGAIYTRSTHGYSLKMSKVLSVGGSSLKWSKSIEKNLQKANEEATRAVVAATRMKKEGRGVVPIVLKSRNHVSRKWVLSLKLCPGERIFRIGSERYKMDPTRRTLHRITAEEEPSSSGVQSEKSVKRSYVPRRFLIGNEEYVRIGNGNQLVRDPKKRARVLASEKVKWSLRTARLRLTRKKKYCQFFTRFGKCNKDDGKCPYIHDPSKVVVCTKFLNGSCSDQNCKLTHKVIPERMPDCSYFLKGSCSKENCPYRHVVIDPDSPVCECFLRGYCADGNECRKKHTYICPAFEATGICSQVSTCKLHHPKKKTERSKSPAEQQKIVRGRYFDGGLIDAADFSVNTTEKLSAEGKDNIVCQEGSFPDYISLDVTDDIVCQVGRFPPDCNSLDVRNEEAEHNLMVCSS